MGPKDLGEILSRLPVVNDPNLLVGTETSDDAGVYRLTPEIALVQTVDYITPLVDDPYQFGQIAATNAISDIFAMGARPLLALNIVGFPATQLPMEVLGEILRGGADKAREADVRIIGGHSIDDNEPKYGMAVTGVVHPDRVLRNSTARPGDRLFLTKPLGMGIVSTAIKRGCAPGVGSAGPYAEGSGPQAGALPARTPDPSSGALRRVEASGGRDGSLQPTRSDGQPAGADLVSRAVTIMTTLNKGAAAAAIAVGVDACTDVSGFGLLGHLGEMTAGSGVGARVSLSRVPVLEGVLELAAQGVVAGGTKRNLAFVQERVSFDDGIDESQRLVLADAQTSGGLLLAVPPQRAGALARALRDQGVPVVAEIGEITGADSSGRIEVGK